MSSVKPSLLFTAILVLFPVIVFSQTKPEQKPDTSEIGGVKADGVIVSASLGGETGAAKIYWAIVGDRVVVLTYLGPDKQTKQRSRSWDRIRTSLNVDDPKATPKVSPSP